LPKPKIFTRQQVISAARTLINTRFHHQGRVPGVGLDCIGTLVAVARLLGMDPHDFIQYGKDPDPEQLLEHIRQGMDEIPISCIAPGDAYLFWWAAPDKPQHFAIKTSSNTIVHAYAELRRVQEQPIPPEWRSKIHSGWAFRGVA